MMPLYIYCLSEDLKYVNINQENKTYSLSYQHEHKLFIYNIGLKLSVANTMITILKLTYTPT